MSFWNRKEEILRPFRWRILDEGVLVTMLETPYLLYEYAPDHPFELAGAVNLSSLKEGDSSRITIYAKISHEDDFIKYGGFEASGPIQDPAILIEAALFPVAAKIEITQLTGRPRQISYVIMGRDETTG